jgi:hypothetical protein
MRRRCDPSYDFNYLDLLERCLLDERVQMVTADAILEFQFK